VINWRCESTPENDAANDRYYERGGVLIHGRPTYWASEAQYFIYWQGEVQRWAICDSSSFAAVKSGQYPGWAFKEDHKHLCQPTGWKEAWSGEWQEPELEVIFRSASYHKPQWDDQLVQKSIVTVEFKGFSMKELNTRYDLKPSQVLQGRPSYWDSTGIYFIYWQQQMGRWAICDSKCLEAVTAGQCPGWAFRSDPGHFANACSWMERRADNWAEAVIETAIIGKCTKGLKVELAGFSKQELNTLYVEKPDEEIQGKITFWDPSAKFFIYWQSSMSRWAICDKASIQHARSGLAPGWAYRTDSHHFARASGWMEVWGNDWKSSTITCTVLEGIVRDHTSMVKSEPKEEEKHKSLSVEQYRMLVQKVYAEKNPSKLSDVGHLLEKYKGREHELYRQVCEKYEMDADELAATAPALSSSESKPEAKDETAEAGAEDDVKNNVFEDGEVPDLQPMEFAVLIQAAYEAYNPKKLQDLGRLLQKYRGRERELYHEVCQKYGVHPAKFHTQHKPEQG